MCPVGRTTKGDIDTPNPGATQGFEAVEYVLNRVVGGIGLTIDKGREQLCRHRLGRQHRNHLQQENLVLVGDAFGRQGERREQRPGIVGGLAEQIGVEQRVMPIDLWLSEAAEQRFWRGAGRTPQVGAAHGQREGKPINLAIDIDQHRRMIARGLEVGAALCEEPDRFLLPHRHSIEDERKTIGVVPVL